MKYKNMILICLSSINFIPETQINADSGGGVAAGVLGGLAVGGMIGAAASRPRREVVYVDQPVYRPMRRVDMLKQRELELNDLQEELSYRETLLSNKEKILAKKDRELRERENNIIKRERSLKNLKMQKESKEMVNDK